eukprot:TRINITY_DN67757_c0_g1_i1.p1 TRINITY_DN67757_c0_g1~~TRINITY_DN67757_c0_g1_i1.p1  ORF type:complete len:896 (+),score=179.87 TRINITY_DN67757_c0_g1_i1:211-2688(+)
MVSTTGNMLKPLSEGCFEYFLAGSRASVGVKRGRYMYEVKIVELLTPSTEAKQFSVPKQSVRVGFSTAGSNLLLDGTDGISFDSDGFLCHNRSRSKCGQAFSRNSTVALVLNLDSSSPNHDTVSLFKDGERASAPQLLPECLKGKVLYPSVTFRNATVQVNFGPEPLVPLSFSCRMIQNADKVDVEEIQAPVQPKDGRHEVLFPVGLPDQGTFEWADMFRKKNPQYVELSERAILSWAEASGLRHKGTNSSGTSKDHPIVSFGVPAFDGQGAIRLLRSLASVQQRDYIVLQLKSSLLKNERSKLLRRFPDAAFKKVAHIIVGEPTLDFKEHTKTLLLKDKQDAAELAFKVKKDEALKQKLVAKRRKELERARKKMEKERLKGEEEKKRKLDEDEGKSDGDTKDEKQKDDSSEKKAEDEEEESDEQEEEQEAEEEETPPIVELTKEEKATLFYKSAIPDVAVTELTKHFVNYSLPSKDDGYDEIRYGWNNESQSEACLKQWILDKKQTTRLEDLVPSQWFKTKLERWQGVYQEWVTKQMAYKAAVAKKETAKKTAAARKIFMAERIKKEGEAKKGSEEVKDEVKDEAIVPESEPMKEDEVEESDDDEHVDFHDLDVFGVEDVCDLGRGIPLFKEFLPEDWMMACLRVELYLLVHAFKRDCGDAERKGIHLDHLGFYYSKYFKKALSLNLFGVESTDALMGLVSDTIFINPQRIIETVISDELESMGVFAKLTEEARRFRILSVDAGDDSAQLKVQVQSHGGFGSNQNGGQQRAQFQHASTQGGKSGNKTRGMPVVKGKGYQGWSQDGGKGGFKAHPYNQGQRTWKS